MKLNLINANQGLEMMEHFVIPALLKVGRFPKGNAPYFELMPVGAFSIFRKPVWFGINPSTLCEMAGQARHDA